jgi:hypothetical protein
MVANIIPLEPFLNSLEIEDEYKIYPLVKMDRRKIKERELIHQCRCRLRLREKQNMKWVWHFIKKGTYEYTR